MRHTDRGGMKMKVKQVGMMKVTISDDERNAVVEIVGNERATLDVSGSALARLDILVIDAYPKE